MKRTGYIKRRKPMVKRNAKRHAKNWTRAHESPERVAFVKWLPCLVCARMPSENAHLGNGGASRKSDANQIVPLCGRFINGHHYELDDVLGSDALFEQKYRAELGGLTLKAWAERVDAAYRAFLGAQGAS